MLTMKRTLALSAVAALSALAVAPAHAEPVAGCPQPGGWALIPATLNQVTADVDARGNADGYVCGKFLPTPEEPAPPPLGVVTDNRTPLS